MFDYMTLTGLAWWTIASGGAVFLILAGVAIVKAQGK